MLAGLVALVTNIEHYVGLHAAQEMARQGAKVFCHSASFSDASVLQEFQRRETSLLAVVGVSPEDTVAKAVECGGHLDILVSNDFFPAIRAPIDEASQKDLEATLAALIVTPFRYAAAAAAHMKCRKKGKLLFVTSAAPLRGLSNYSMYVTGRGATNTLAVSLSKELAPFNITVNAIAPNYVESESYFSQDLRQNPAVMEKFAKKVPLGRLGTPEEVAAVISFFASNGSDFVTGQVVPVAGGWA